MMKTIGVVGLVLVGGAWLLVKRFGITKARVVETIKAGSDAWMAHKEVEVVHVSSPEGGARTIETA